MDQELLSLQGRAGSALSGGLGARLHACSSPPLPSADGWRSFTYLVVWAVIAARNAWRDFVRLRDTPTASWPPKKATMHGCELITGS